jgi:hypothetical protein
LAAIGRGDAERGLRLAAAGARLREGVTSLSPADHDQLQRAIAAAKHTLEPATAAAMWAQGQTMAVHNVVVEYALDQIEVEVLVGRGAGLQEAH